MPKNIDSIRELIKIANRSDATSVILKRNKTNAKFKIRCSRYLYVYKLTELERFEKIKATLPVNLTKTEIKFNKKVN